MTRKPNTDRIELRIEPIEPNSASVKRKCLKWGGGRAGLCKGISIEPNRSTEPNTTGTEPTEPSTSL
eukprot:11548614-Alexandrium_andersonii.AAC.1